ncbi:hypothetical protein PINS_up015364 [Pythium insidiosum]|nr:hypothetical protein PINS_up015364 [Pythium insidiosum]
MEVYGAYRSNIALIRDAITDNKVHMEQVSQSLSTFQSGLLGVEREMLPIYKLTERLRETQRNIDLCVQELRRVNDNFIAAQQLSPTLMNGAKFDQEEYVEALEKLLVAISFLESHRSYEGSAKALDQAKELLAQARKKCKADFLSAVNVLCRGSRDDEGRLAWSKPSTQAVEKVKQLLKCLISSNIDQVDLLSEYGKQRFQALMTALHDDGNHTSRRSERSSGWRKWYFASEELSHAAFRHAVYPILDSVRRDLTSSLQVGSATSKTVATTAALTQQLEPFNLMLLHEMLTGRVKDLEALMQPPLLLRDRKGKGLEDPWVLPKTLNQIVSETATAAKQKLFGFQFELTEHIGAGDRSISKDGNVHPVSSHMLKFLRHVCEHTKPLRVLLAKESNVTPVTFIETVVMQLVEALQSKSTQFKGRTDLKHLFLTNNFSFIANSLPQCEDKEIAEHFTKEIRPRVEELRDDAIRAFVQVSYESFETFLCDPKEKLVYAKGGQLLTLESGRLLKEKFTRFNTQIDDIHETQRHFIVAEPRVRHQLIQAAIDSIITPYTAFYEKYSGIHFSKKNTAKYLKYTPKAAEQLLKELFLGEVIGDSK